MNINEIVVVTLGIGMALNGLDIGLTVTLGTIAHTDSSVHGCFCFMILTGGVKVALDVGWQIGRDEVNNDIQGVDLANGQQHVVTVRRTDKGRRLKVSVSSNCL